MLYRVSQRTLYRNINTNLNFLTWNMARANNQLATGKQVNKPSDDPTGSSLIFEMRSVLAGVTQYNKDVAIADDWLKQTEDVLQNMKLIVERANELAEQMSTDTYKPENMDVAAEEVSRLMEGLIKIGNTKIGDRYIFSGQMTEVQPFHDLLEIMAPYADPGNSSSYTGFVKQPLDVSYNPRPDIPTQSKIYLAEVVTEGGTGVMSQADVTINGSTGVNSDLIFTATEAYSGSDGNNIQIQYNVVPGPLPNGWPATANVDSMDPPDQTTVIRIDMLNTATANDIIAAITNNQSDGTGYPVPVSEFVTAAPVGTGAGIVNVAGNFPLTGGMNNDLAQARTEADPMGENNTILYEADAGGAYDGTAGNAIQVQYVKGAASTPFALNLGGFPPLISVQLETDGVGDVITTANDVITAINNAAIGITAKLPPAGAGTGTIEIPGAAPQTQSFQLSGGRDQGAQYRISVDGGVTWGAELFDAAETLQPEIVYNDKLGHAYMTTDTPGLANDIHIVAENFGTSGEDICVEIVDGAALAVNIDPADPYHIVVTLNTGVSTADDVVNAINAHAMAGRMVHASLPDYREGGTGIMVAQENTYLSGADGDITRLGHATLETEFHFEPPDSDPNVIFTAVQHGELGPQSDIKVEYVKATAPNQTYVDPPAAPVAPDDFWTITVHLEVDANNEIVATAQDVVKAVNLYHFNNPNSRVTANLPEHSDGGGVVELMDPTLLSGGDDDEHISLHGARMRFEGDGTALLAGDRFEIEVGYYHGDDQDIDVNSNVGTRVKINVTGEEALGATGAYDNILDTLSRLKFALEQHDTVDVADELDRLGEAGVKLTTEMARVGVRIVRNEFTYNILESTELNSTTRMSRVEDLDIAEAITNLQTKQTAYEALLSSTSLITSLSLVDYIR